MSLLSRLENLERSTPGIAYIVLRIVEAVDRRPKHPEWANGDSG
jgi:hypothetical protein